MRRNLSELIIFVIGVVTLRNNYTDDVMRNDATGAAADHGCEKAESEVSDSLEVAKKLLMYRLMSVTCSSMPISKTNTPIKIN